MREALGPGMSSSRSIGFCFLLVGLLALLVIAVIVIWGTSHEHEPFVTQSPVVNLLAMQLSLLVISVPIIVLTAATAERQQKSTERAAQEAALQASHAHNKELTGRLISAQETERARIARRLHDDVNQQLAAYSIALSRLQRALPEGANDVQAEVVRLQQQTINLSEQIRDLSHELHPGVLYHAGLAVALRGSCTEFGLQHGIEVTVEAEDNLSELPKEVALCLYRIAQETLHNAARHGRANRARVALCRVCYAVELTVRDNGCGFNATEARRARGLGLVSIDERVRLLRGNLHIKSRPHWGTEVYVRVPLAFEETKQQGLWDLA
jgi:two-component system sensor histidine kinase UhpB